MLFCQGHHTSLKFSDKQNYHVIRFFVFLNTLTKLDLPFEVEAKIPCIVEHLYLSCCHGDF